MKQNLGTLLNEIYQFGFEHDTLNPAKEKRMRNVTPLTGEFLRFIIRSHSFKSVLEIGTSNGYSTLWLADAVVEEGGRVTTLEVDLEKIKLAEQNFKRSGLDSIIDLKHQNAETFLQNYVQESFDFIFMDSDRVEYPSWWPDIQRVLKPNGVIVVDNVLSHKKELEDFVSLVKNTSEVESVVLPVEQGLMIISKKQ